MIFFQKKQEMFVDLETSWLDTLTNRINMVTIVSGLRIRISEMYTSRLVVPLPLTLTRRAARVTRGCWGPELPSHTRRSMSQ